MAILHVTISEVSSTSGKKWSFSGSWELKSVRNDHAFAQISEKLVKHGYSIWADCSPNFMQILMLDRNAWSTLTQPNFSSIIWWNFIFTISRKPPLNKCIKAWASLQPSYYTFNKGIIDRDFVNVNGTDTQQLPSWLDPLPFVLFHFRLPTNVNKLVVVTQFHPAMKQGCFRKC